MLLREWVLDLEPLFEISKVELWELLSFFQNSCSPSPAPTKKNFITTRCILDGKRDTRIFTNFIFFDINNSHNKIERSFDKIKWYLKLLLLLVMPVIWWQLINEIVFSPSFTVPKDHGETCKIHNFILNKKYTFGLNCCDNCIIMVAAT